MPGLMILVKKDVLAQKVILKSMTIKKLWKHVKIMIGNIFLEKKVVQTEKFIFSNGPKMG